MSISRRPARGRSRGLRRRVTALLAALGLVAVLVTAQGTGTTEAAWADREHARTTFTAGRIGIPAANGCNFSGRTFTPRWTAPPAPSVTPTSYQYRLFWTPLLGTEQVILPWTTAGTATQFSYTVPTSILTAGTYRFEARAVAGAWTGSTRSGTASVVSLLGVISINGCSWS